jgi:hypothetical protein
MDRAFPRALVTGYEELIDHVVLPDADDRHVVAAARRSGATHIVTQNLQDFPSSILAPFGIEPVSPDALLIALLDSDFETTVRTLERHRSGLVQPPMTPADYLAALIRAGMVDVASRLSGVLRSK